MFSLSSRQKLFAFSLFLSAVSFAQIPDEIDFNKYWQIYVRDKAVSDQLRGEANRSQSDWRTKSQAVESNRSRQSANRSTRSSNDSEISALQSEKQNLEFEIPRLVSDEAALDREAREQSQRLNWVVNERNRSQENTALLDRNFQDLRRRKDDSDRATNQAERETSDARNDLEEKRLEIQRTETALKRVEETLQTLPQELARDRNELQNQRQLLQTAQADASRAKDELEQLRSQIEPLRERLRQAEVRFRQADRDADALEADIVRLQGQKAQLEAQIEQIRGQRQANRQEGNRLEREINQTERQLNQARSEPESPERDAKVRDLEAQLADLNARKARNDAEDATLDAQMQATRNQLQSTEQQVNQIVPRAMALRQEAQNAQADADSAKTQIDALQQRMDPVQERHKAAKARVEQYESKITQLEKEVSQAERQLANAQSEKQQLTARLAQLNREENALQARLQDSRRRLEEARTLSQRLANELSNAGLELDRARAELARLNNEVSIADSRLRETLERQNNLRRHIASQRDRLDWVISRISDIIEENPRLDREYADLVRALPGLVSARDAAKVDFDARNAKASAAEATTSASLAKYQEVRRRYDGLLIAATEKGRGQGLPLGRSEGAPVGGRDGKKLGTEEGDRDGTAAGREWGRKQGAIDGQLQGDKDGYAHGRSSPTEYEAGRAEGWAQGKADAEAEAMREDYPAARRTRRNELLAKIPDKVENINIRPSMGAIEMDRPQWISTQILAKMPKLDAVMMAIENIMVEVPVDPGRADCNVGYVDFVNACREAFKKAYIETYTVAYNDAHKEARKVAYDATYPVSFEAHKMDLYKQSYDPAYAAAYSAADMRGAADARNAGYADGKKAGYAERIEGARAEAKAKGIADEEALFQQSSIVKMLGAEIVGSGTLVAGSSFSVRVALANFGGQAAEKGSVKIQVEEESGNVAVETKTVALPALAGLTRFNVTNVALGKISTNAGAETIKLKVTMIAPNGIRDEKIISIATGLHIFSEMKVEMNNKPWVNRGLFAPKAHKIKVSVKNPRSFSSKNGFVVQLELPKLEGFVSEVGQASTVALGGGQRADVELRYKITNKELGAGEKWYPVKIKVYLNKRLSAEQTVMIDPVNGI